MICLTKSQAQYLKAIYEVSLTGDIKVTKIADHLNYSKPSVIRALKSLDEISAIKYQKEKITLTEKGRKYALKIIKNDNILLKFFVDVLEIEEELAEKDVENIKHSITCYSLGKLENYLSNEFGVKFEDDTCKCTVGCFSCK